MPEHPSHNRHPEPQRGEGSRSPLDVAVGIIARDGRILIARRKPGDSLGGLWEFPGGKRKEGETMEECLAREIREELGIGIQVGPKRIEIEHRYPQRMIRLHCFECRVLEGEPRAIDCAEWLWASPEDLTRYEFPPASRPLIEELTRDRQRPVS